MMTLLAASLTVAPLFIELGVVIIIMALLARAAVMVGMSPIPLYLLLGLFLGETGIIPLQHITAFIQVGAEIGVILLLFMLGLEYTGSELSANLRTGLRAGLLDIVLGFLPGIALGLLLGWQPVAALMLGGVTYISSSGVISKLLSDLGWMGNRETPAVLSILVMEDLAMAIFLPIMAVLIIGETLLDGLVTLAVAMVAVFVVLMVAIRYGERLSLYIKNPSDEVLLLTVLGLTFLTAGIAQGLQVSAAVGAFLVGIALSGQVAETAHVLLAPLRDLFAATFFLFFSLQINASEIPPVLALAVALGVVSTLTKIYTGWWAAGHIGISTRGRFRAGMLLVSRGEFSIVIANIGAAAGLNPQLLPLAATYVLLMAMIGPVLARTSDPVIAGILRRRKAAASQSAAPDDHAG